MGMVMVALAGFFFLGHFLEYLFQKTKIPDLLILTILGFLLGPIFGVVEARSFGDAGQVVATIALIVILYQGGLSMSLSDLKLSATRASYLALVVFVLTVLAMASLGIAIFAMNPQLALLFAIPLGSTSSAIVIPMTQFLPLDEKGKNLLSLESAVTDILAIVMFVTLLSGFTQGSFRWEDIAIRLGPFTLLAVLIGGLSALLFAALRHYSPHRSRTPFVGEAWALLTYGLLELLSLNGAIGVLVLGFLLSNLQILPTQWSGVFDRVPIRKNEQALLKQIVFLLKTLFFVYLGVLLPIPSWSVFLFSLLATVVLFGIRVISVKMTLPARSTTQGTAALTAMLGPRGLACAVLASLPAQQGVAGGEFIQELIFGIIPLTIVLCSLLVALENTVLVQTWKRVFFGRYLVGEPKLPSVSLPKTLPETSSEND